MFSQKKRRLQGELTVAFQYLKGDLQESWKGTLHQDCSDSDRTKCNGFKLKEGRFRSDIRKKLLTRRVVSHWNRLPRDAVDAPSLEMFKTRLDEALSSLF